MKLERYNESMSGLMAQFELTDEQLKFVKSPQENIELSKVHDSFHPIIGMNDNDEAVVFFVLDTDSEFKALYDVEPAIYVRSFSTDTRYLRQGYAKEALRLLPEYVEKNYPDIDYITLIVDEPNDKARDMYIKQAFEMGSKVQGSRFPGNWMSKQIK